jgi:hypothetical protein
MVLSICNRQAANVSHLEPQCPCQCVTWTRQQVSTWLSLVTFGRPNTNRLWW